MAISEQFTKQNISDAELMALPADGYKHELVNGEVTNVPTGNIHDIIVINIGTALKSSSKGRGYVAGSQAGFRMSNKNIRCPDVSFIRKDRYPDGPPVGFAEFAPDICVEIISPSENRSDALAKVGEYFESGAQLVWHVFPEARRVVVYTSPIDVITLEADHILTAGELLSDFHTRVSELLELE